MKESVKLIECLRNTWQGEGVNSGQRVSLFRFKACNRRCQYCDTIIKMRAQQEAAYYIDDLQKILEGEKTNPLISGGEPTIERHFEDTLKLINNLDYKGFANLETNGYNLLGILEKIDPSKKINISYSPKIFNDAELDEEIINSKIFKDYENVYYKIVYEDNKLIHYYLDILESLNVHHRVFLMPEGITRENLIMNSGKVFDACEKYRFNFSSRDHIIYGFI